MARFFHSIAFRVSALILATYLALSGAAMAFIAGAVRTSFIGIEDAVASHDRLRLEKLFAAEAERLGELCREYSIWDETYGFMEKFDTAYFERNMYADWRASVGLRSIAILDSSGTLVYAFRAEDDPIVSRSEEDGETAALLSAARQALADSDRSLGLAVSDDASVFFSVEPIVRSDGAGPPAGHLIFSKKADASFFARLGDIAAVAVDLAPPGAVVGIDRDKTTIVETFDLSLGGSARFPVSVSRDRGLWRMGQRLLFGIGAAFNLSTLAACTALLLLLRGSVIKPIYRISSHVDAVIRKGDFSARLAASGKDELATLADDINSLLSHIQDHEAELKRLNEELERVANTDRLTGLANRRRFETHLQEEMRRLRREARGGGERDHLAFLLCDVDHFKNFNDTYGHVAGDACLSAIGQALESCVRRPGDLACRFGGEEFLVVLPHCGPLGAAAVAENLLRAVRSLAVPHAASPVADVVTVSVGGAVFSLAELSDASVSVETMLAAADAALYRAKKEGRNRYRA